MEKLSCTQCGAPMQDQSRCEYCNTRYPAFGGKTSGAVESFSIWSPSLDSRNGFWSVSTSTASRSAVFRTVK